MTTTVSLEEFEALTGRPLADFAFQCHAASLALVRGLRGGRVARGSRPGVGAQHSWVVLDEDCYDPRAEVLDPTLWSYEDAEPYVWSGLARAGGYRPHGSGSIWRYGQPPSPTGEVVKLAEDPGPDARLFLSIAAPDGLDRAGWAVLLHAPVGDWPAKEVVTAAYHTPDLAAFIPIDIVGMVTDENPSELYR